MQKALTAAIFVFMIFFGFSAAHADLVVNGGFETGDFTGWTKTVGSGNNPIWCYVWGGSPRIGNYSATFGAIYSDDTITQNLATTPGQSYTFSFWLANNVTEPPYDQSDFYAYWNGNQVFGTNSTSNFGFTQYSFTETASGTSTSISFAGRQPPGWFTLDNVSVTPSAAPLPGALLLLAPGLAGLAVLKRKYIG